MNITITSVGSVKEDYIALGIEEFLKRLRSYAKITLNTVNAVTVKPTVTKDMAQEKEAKLILSKSPGYKFALDENGTQIKSVEFADKLTSLTNSGISTVTFIIGSAYGLSTTVKEKVNEVLALSKLTFPHQLIKLMLLEQIYRAFTIINNEQYHK